MNMQSSKACAPARYNPLLKLSSQGLSALLKSLIAPQAPNGWTKWVIPAYEYLYVKAQEGSSTAFSSMITVLKEKKFELVGAVHEFYAPKENGQLYLYFPIRKL